MSFLNALNMYDIVPYESIFFFFFLTDVESNYFFKGCRTSPFVLDARNIIYHELDPSGFGCATQQVFREQAYQRRA